jgi:hypothetical protein
LQIGVFVSVFFFEAFEVIQLILEANNLIFQLDDFTFAINQLRFFILQVKSLSVNEFVQIVNAGKLL